MNDLHSFVLLVSCSETEICFWVPQTESQTGSEGHKAEEIIFKFTTITL